MDTCQYCDKTQNLISQISSEIKSGNARRGRELKQEKQALESHLKESKVRFASLKYDMLVLSRKQRFHAPFCCIHIILLLFFITGIILVPKYKLSYVYQVLVTQDYKHFSPFPLSKVSNSFFTCFGDYFHGIDKH